MVERPPFRPERPKPAEVPPGAAPDGPPIPDRLMGAAFGNREVARLMQQSLVSLAKKAEADNDDRLRRTVEGVMAGDLSPRALLAHEGFLDRARTNLEGYQRDVGSLEGEEREEFDERARQMAESVRARMPAAWFPTIGLEVFGVGDDGRPVPPVTPTGLPDGGAMMREFLDDVEKGQ